MSRLSRTSTELSDQAALLRSYVRQGKHPLLQTMSAMADALDMHARDTARMELEIASAAEGPLLASRLRDAAFALSGMLQAGELAGAHEDALFHLRSLSLELLRWADEARGDPPEVGGNVVRLFPLGAVG